MAGLVFSLMVAAGTWTNHVAAEQATQNADIKQMEKRLCTVEDHYGTIDQRLRTIEAELQEHEAGAAKQKKEQARMLEQIWNAVSTRKVR